MMTQQEAKRLQKLQEDAHKEAGNYSLTDLTVPDLLLLLREDPQLRQLIREIAMEPEAEAELVAEDEPATDDALEATPVAPAYSPPPPSRYAPHPVALPVAPAPIDALRQQLGPELLLLRAVQADAEISTAWLGETPESEGKQLLRVVVCAGQWDLLSELWEKLANRCKQGQRAAHENELLILQAAMDLHNLRWLGRQARMVEVLPGTAYDYEKHQRGTSNGSIVRTLWLPGMVNAGGQLHKKPLVAT